MHENVIMKIGDWFTFHEKSDEKLLIILGIDAGCDGVLKPGDESGRIRSFTQVMRVRACPIGLCCLGLIIANTVNVLVNSGMLRGCRHERT